MILSNVGRFQNMLSGRVKVLTRIWGHPLNSGSKVKAILDYVLWNISRFTLRAQHVVSLPHGLKIILSPAENYGTEIYVHTFYDFEEMLFLAHVLKEGDLFLDVGASVGIYSIVVAGIAGSRVIALEPIPATNTLLNDNIRVNHLEHAITALKVAAGAASGRAEMTVNQGGLNHVVDARSHGQTATVPMVAIDDIIDDQLPYAMKLDVEGLEMQALRGAHKVLSNPQLRVIVIELQNGTLHKYDTSETEVREYLNALRFIPYAYDPIKRLLKPGVEMKELNQIFLRVDDDVYERLKTAKNVEVPGFPNGI